MVPRPSPHARPLTLQPPKRRAPAAAPPPAAKKPRQSALAKEHNISAATELEIREAYALFSASDGTLPTPSVRRALTALGAPASSPAELRELVDVLDPEAEGWVAYENFVAVAALKLAARGEEELRGEVERAWRLFVQPGEDRITFATLKRVARELREEVDESVLRDMMREAGGGGVVGIKEFEGVMRRAGVFG